MLFLLNTEKLTGWKRHKQFPQRHTVISGMGLTEAGWLGCVSMSVAARGWTWPAGITHAWLFPRQVPCFGSYRCTYWCSGTPCKVAFLIGLKASGCLFLSFGRTACSRDLSYSNLESRGHNHCGKM